MKHDVIAETVPNLKLCDAIRCSTSCFNFNSSAVHQWLCGSEKWHRKCLRCFSIGSQASMLPKVISSGKCTGEFDDTFLGTLQDTQLKIPSISFSTHEQVI
ncbi:uncharacterized protein LOC143242227 [Tachypleus tridentatus]|uniref:uncharacterized protein LOC143242227 n=1 Tax=Tachypleus tridentatus TaxID=6853 RepID=UPI003FD65087